MEVVSKDQLVSIIIPLYNRVDYIIETLHSIQNQTYTNWECIIVDDGSTDDSYAVVDAWIHKDHRFKLFKRPVHHRSGGCGARNYGFLQSKGAFILWLDSDDLIVPTYLQQQMTLIEAHQGDLSVCGWQFFDAHQKQFPQRLIVNNLVQDGLSVIDEIALSKSYLICHCYLTKRSVVAQAGLWNEYLKVNQDGEFFCRVLVNAKVVVNTKGILALYRADTNDKISQKINYEKLEHRMYSIDLMKNTLLIVDKNRFTNYINNFKILMYKNLYTREPEFLQANKAFFKDIEALMKEPLSIRIKQQVYKLLKK